MACAVSSSLVASCSEAITQMNYSRQPLASQLFEQPLIANSSLITHHFLPAAEATEEEEEGEAQREQAERVEAVLGVAEDRAGEEGDGAGERERRRQGVAPRAVGARGVGLAPAQHEDRDEGEREVRDEEEGERRERPLDGAAED